MRAELLKCKHRMLVYDEVHDVERELVRVIEM